MAKKCRSGESVSFIEKIVFLSEAWFWFSIGLHVTRRRECENSSSCNRRHAIICSRTRYMRWGVIKRCWTELKKKLHKHLGHRGQRFRDTADQMSVIYQWISEMSSFQWRSWFVQAYTRKLHLERTKDHQVGCTEFVTFVGQKTKRTVRRRLNG